MCIIVLISTYTKSENPCFVMYPASGNDDWGIGGYYIPDSFSLDVYSENTNAVVGKLTSNNSYLSFDSEHGERIGINKGNLTYIGHYTNAILKVKKCFNPKYERIFWQDREEVLYIDKEEARKKGAIFSSFRDILVKNTIESREEDRTKIGINLRNNCLNIRDAPNKLSNKVICALGNDWTKDFETVVEIIEVKTNWAKVYYYELHPSSNYPTNDEDCYSVKKNENVGWIKAISESGFPNVWFAVSGY